MSANILKRTGYYKKWTQNVLIFLEVNPEYKSV